MFKTPEQISKNAHVIGVGVRLFGGGRTSALMPVSVIAYAFFFLRRVYEQQKIGRASCRERV